MFSYYGSKSKIVHLYPAPKHSLIIEPFAGSARYALKYFDRDVILIDKYEVIIRIWKYLQSASPKDILGLPRLKEGESLDQFNLSPIEKEFLGFNIAGGVAVPQKKTTWAQTTHRPNNQNVRLKTIAGNLYKIRHWKIFLDDYTSAPNVEATWFIDPPYISGGKYYKHNAKKLDFDEISRFCKSRKGQTIVCENSGAAWMNFLPLAKNGGTFGSKMEVFWTNEQVLKQSSLFESI